MTVPYNKNKLYKIRLEGFSSNTDYKEFYNPPFDTEKYEFGDIIVSSDKLGVFREIITGVSIPMMWIYPDASNGSKWYNIPLAPYHGRFEQSYLVDEEYYKDYLFTNDEDEIKAALCMFKEKSRYYMKSARSRYREELHKIKKAERFERKIEKEKARKRVSY